MAVIAANPSRFRLHVLQSVRRALLDFPTSGLRAVAVTTRFPHVTARFVYDRAPNDDELELISDAETCVIADTDDPIQVDFAADFCRSDEEPTLEDGEEWL